MSGYRHISIRPATLFRLLLLLGPLAVAAQGAQPTRQAPADRSAGSAAAWQVAAPDAANAWFDLLATLRVSGPAAFPLTASPRPGVAADPGLARTLADTRESEVLHFVPLYHPSGDRAAMAAALRIAAADASAPEPRATLVVAALRRAMSAPLRQRALPALANALERVALPAADPRLLPTLQQSLDNEFLPALAAWLSAERLDAGQLIIAAGIGPEGRLFAGTADRRDNIVAVGLFADDPDAEAPLLAFVREVCYPAVTRAVQAERIDGPAASVARRSGVAAVRCGASLLDARLPARAERYRAFWLRQAGVRSAGADVAGAFHRAFPEDAALAPHLERALRRVRNAP
ncbi:MAG: hypothetical protein KF709_08615 [Gemmatimonadaceae bacterium]|nr:hypothetical protein [Gemmatimonadaceae bacterium]